MPDAPTLVLIGCLDALALGSTPLVVDEETGTLSAALQQRGLAPLVWNRRFSGTAPASPWPDPVSCSVALLRMPKSRDALEMALHAAAGATEAHAQIVLFGANDEGIRSAARPLEAVADDIVTIDTRRHSRVIAGRRRARIADLKSRLSDWRRVDEIEILGRARPWISYPGTFAKGGLDEGTALLLDHLPSLTQTRRALDYAGGTGVIAAAIAERAPNAVVDLVEIDAVALAAARENAPGVRSALGASLTMLAGSAYDLILSNPPIHDGIAEDHTALASLIAAAPAHLVPGGELRMVVQRRIDAAHLIETVFGACTQIAATGRFRVLSGIRSRERKL